MVGLKMAALADAVNILKIRFDEDLKCIETGTIRSYNERYGSTFLIAATLGDRGSLVSVDISSKSIKISKDICKLLTNVEWVHSDSLEYLKNQKNKFHLVFLDSVNDENHIFEEFKLLVPRIISGGIIVVDDAGVTREGKKNRGVQEKGRKISKFLLSIGCENFVRDKDSVVQLWIEMENSVSKKIREVLKLDS